MENVRIPGRQMQGLIAMYLLGSSIIAGGESQAKQDSWICLIFAFVLSIPLYWVYAKFLDLYEGRDFFRCILLSCGKIAGTVICLLYTLFTLHVTGLIIRIFVEFIHNTSLRDTPMMLITGCIVCAVIYALRNRLPVVARLCTPLLIVYAVTLAVLFAAASPIVDFDNLKPILHRSFGDLASSTFTQFTVPFSQIAMLLPAFGSVDPKEKLFPILLKGGLFGGAILLTINIRNVLVLGYSDSTYMFPSYSAAGIISIGQFIVGVEVLVGAYVLMTGLLRTCVLLYTTAKGFMTVFRFHDYEPLVIPCGILAITLTFLVHDNTEDLFSFLKYYPAYALPLQAIVPILLLAVGLIRKKSGEKKRRKPYPQKEPAPEGPSNR